MTRSPAHMLLTAMVVVLMTSCADRSPDPLQPVTPPVQPPTPPPAPPPSLPPGFPAVTRPADVFKAPYGVFQQYESYHGGELASRFVLYDDSTFALQFSSPRWGFFEYPGRYVSAGEKIDLKFDANAGAWRATAMLQGDLLAVKYNLDMSLSDFIDAVYMRARQ